MTSTRRRIRIAGVCVAIAWILSACSPARGDVATPVARNPPVSESSTPIVAVVPVTKPTPREPVGLPRAVRAPADPCVDLVGSEPHVHGPVPDSLRRAIDNRLTHPNFSDLDMSVSIWLEGYGEVAAYNPDLALLPASNQKLITAVGIAEVLPLGDRFRTAAFLDSDDLVLIAGGDPTLTSADLQSMAEQVAAFGVSNIDRVLIDASRYTGGTAAPGWQDWQLPRYVGPLSAFMVDDNRYRDDAAYLADPAQGNGELLLTFLREAGIRAGSVGTVEQFDSRGRAPIAMIESESFEILVEQLLLQSDNQHADLLVTEIGARYGDGSITAGTRRIERALAAWCLDLTGTSGDGSGLSRENFRSARELRRLLDHGRGQVWGDWFESALPVAGQSGTLANRFLGTAGEGRIRAKTGTIIGGISLSGYASTVGGRDVVFSILINGERDVVRAARDAMDELIVAVVGWPG